MTHLQVFGQKLTPIRRFLAWKSHPFRPHIPNMTQYGSAPPPPPGVQAVLCSNCRPKTFVYSHKYTTFSSKKHTPLYGKFYGYLHHQNGLGHTLKSPNESCETSVSVWNYFQVKGGNRKIPTQTTF